LIFYRKLARGAALAGVLAAICGPAAAYDPIGLTTDAQAEAQKLSRGPKLAPEKNATSFEPALRCMDRLFTQYGVRDVSLLIEDIPDATSKVKVGARDMFMTATSRMTTRSHAIRLVPFSRGSVAFIDRKDFIEKSRYSLQGSVSQLDESLVKRQADGALCLGPVCIGAAASDSYNAVGLDLNVIRTSDLSLEPGVTSKNTVLVVKHGTGADTEVNASKFGLSFNFSMSRSEGQAEAMRTLVELGAIELYGKLEKIPYWICLGNDSSSPAVASEVDDWWESMVGDVPTMVRWLQGQMIARGIYKGEVDGQANDPLLAAINIYKGALGLPQDGQIDESFFRAYLAADHSKIEGGAQAAFAQIPPPQPPPPPAPDVAANAPAAPAAQAARAAPPELVVQDRRGPGASYSRGQSYEILVAAPQDGNLYCWLIDEDHHLNQFFPAPELKNPMVQGGAQIVFPGPLGFGLEASRSGKRETIACMQTGKDLGFDPVGKASAAVRDLDSLKFVLGRLTSGNFLMGAFDVQPR
jgi:hypothetical protein